MIRGTETPLTYTELLAAGQPRTITSDTDADRIQSQIDALLDKGELSRAEEEYLSLLGDLVLAWEDGKHEMPDLPPLDYLRALIEDGGLRQADLVPAVFPTPSLASEILSGKRPLTYDYVQRLSRYFHVSPALFFEQSRATNLG
jgi:HTH-type transcriptional regulator/antitoxin HigA